jgi:hypothetical protein
MKIILSLLFVVLFVFVSFTQPVKNKYYEETPGDELQVYSIHHYNGVVATAIGAPIVGFGLYILKDKQREKEGIFGVMVGGIITAVGMYYLIEAPIHLKRAGILMNENGVGIKIKLE